MCSTVSKAFYKSTKKTYFVKIKSCFASNTVSYYKNIVWYSNSKNIFIAMSTLHQSCWESQIHVLPIKLKLKSSSPGRWGTILLGPGGS